MKVINDATSLTSFMETVDKFDLSRTVKHDMVHFHHFDLPGLKVKGTWTGGVATTTQHTTYETSSDVHT